MRFAVSLIILVIYFYSCATAQAGELQVLHQIGVLLPAPSIPAALGDEHLLAHRSVSSGDAYPENLSLSLSSAIKRGLEHNLRLLLSEQDTRSAQAARYRSLSNLLPDIKPRIEEIGQQNNMKAFGFPGFPGMSSTVGAFSFFDARVEAKQPILDLEALRKHRASAHNLKASNIDLVLAQEAFATADENHISYLYAYNPAKVALARASGGAESSALQYLGLTAN